VELGRLPARSPDAPVASFVASLTGAATLANLWPRIAGLT
jgi:hypothetical protein